MLQKPVDTNTHANKIIRDIILDVDLSALPIFINLEEILIIDERSELDLKETYELARQIATCTVEKVAVRFLERSSREETWSEGG
jgi:hypothetical protein